MGQKSKADRDAAREEFFRQFGRVIRPADEKPEMTIVQQHDVEDD